MLLAKSAMGGELFIMIFTLTLISHLSYLCLIICIIIVYFFISLSYIIYLSYLTCWRKLQCIPLDFHCVFAQMIHIDISINFLGCAG